MIVCESARCPRCNNADVHIVVVEPSARSNTVDIYHCECGKCAMRFLAAAEREGREIATAAIMTPVLEGPPLSP